MVDIELLKQLRKETDISFAECKKALEEADGDIEKARGILQERGKEMAAKKGDREVGEGRIAAYVHNNGTTGVLLDLRCETDFVAKSDDFQSLAHELTLHIAAMSPEDVDELLEQNYVKDTSKTISDLLKENIAKLGENIVVRRFTRYQLS